MTAPLVATADGVFGLALFAFALGLAAGLAIALMIWWTPGKVGPTPPADEERDPTTWSRP